MQRGEFSEHDAAVIAKQLVEGLAHLHKKGVVHRDLKPENLLLRTKDSNDIIIADFGFSRLVGTSHFLSTICGTPAYVAPEILTGKGHGIEVDMWSAGVIICGLPASEGELDEHRLWLTAFGLASCPQTRCSAATSPSPPKTAPNPKCSNSSKTPSSLSLRKTGPPSPKKPKTLSANSSSSTLPYG